MGPDSELRLLWAALLCAGPLVAGYRLARRYGPPLEAAADALLLAYLVQYLAVGIPGILGFLTPLWITVMAGMLTASLWLLSRRGPPIVPATPLSLPQQLGMLACALFVFGYVGGYVYFERLLPPTATDALAYHLPAAAQWLQRGQIGIFQTWFFNPANTFSPLAGSIWATWLMAPMGSDILARLVELGPLVLLFLLIIQLCLEMGVRPTAATVLAGAAVISRPFFSESILAKDDLFVAAFFAAALIGLSPRRLRQPIGPARLGTAMGLLLAVKFTAVMSLPLLLIAVDAPIRAGWRWSKYAVVMAGILLLAGPWYLRNWILVGNPVFPETVNWGIIRFHGLFVATRSLSLTTLAGLKHVVCDGYYSMPGLLCTMLGILWLVALVRGALSLRADPLRRCILLGPPIGLAIFFFFSPYGEVRFIFPVFVLLFAACALALRESGVIEFIGLILLTEALTTTFVSKGSQEIVQFACDGAALAGGGVALWWLGDKWMKFKSPGRLLGGAAALIVILLAWSCWSDLVDDYHESWRKIWPYSYGSQGDVWAFVQQSIPADATIAYSNQFMIYPLYGFGLSRHLMYVPVRQGESIATLRMPPRLSGEQISAAASATANHPMVPHVWMANLQATGAQFLLVGAADDAPEIALARGDPAHFQRVFANDVAMIYRITFARPKSHD
jgi:hypothetical protein